VRLVAVSANGRPNHGIGGSFAMRVRRISGVKRVTILGPATTGHVVVRERMDMLGAETLRFTVIKPSGEVSRGEVRLDLGPIKKDSRALRPIERRLRKLIRAEYKALGRYLVLHEKSRRKRRNGWARDLGGNIAKVIRRRS
jgi:hypothetical protein